MNLIYIKLEGERYVKTFRNDKPKSNLAKYLSKNKKYEYEDEICTNVSCTELSLTSSRLQKSALCRTELIVWVRWLILHPATLYWPQL